MTFLVSSCARICESGGIEVFAWQDTGGRARACV